MFSFFPSINEISRAAITILIPTLFKRLKKVADAIETEGLGARSVSCYTAAAVSILAVPAILAVNPTLPLISALSVLLAVATGEVIENQGDHCRIEAGFRP